MPPVTKQWMNKMDDSSITHIPFAVKIAVVEGVPQTKDFNFTLRSNKTGLPKWHCKNTL
jgi:hypothetical protein